jgi:hypothetical protein
MARPLTLAALLVTLAPGCATAIAYDSIDSKRHQRRFEALKDVQKASFAEGSLYVAKRTADGHEEVLTASLFGQDREGRPRTLTHADTAVLPPTSTPVALAGSEGSLEGRPASWWKLFFVLSGTPAESAREALVGHVLVAVEVPKDGDEWLLRVSVPPPGGRRLEETPEGPVPVAADLDAKLYRIEGPTGVKAWGPTLEFIAFLPVSLTLDVLTVALAPVIFPLGVCIEGVENALGVVPKGHCMP